MSARGSGSHNDLSFKSVQFLEAGPILPSSYSSHNSPFSSRTTPPFRSNCFSRGPPWHLIIPAEHRRYLPHFPSSFGGNARATRSLLRTPQKLFCLVQFWQLVRQELINRRNSLPFNPRFFFRQQPSIFIHGAENGTCL